MVREELLDLQANTESYAVGLPVAANRKGMWLKAAKDGGRPSPQEDPAAFAHSSRLGVLICGEGKWELAGFLCRLRASLSFPCVLVKLANLCLYL